MSSTNLWYTPTRGLRWCSLLLTPQRAKCGGGARPPSPAARRMAGRTQPVGRRRAGRRSARCRGRAAQGAAGGLGDPAGPGQAEGQGARDQQLDGDAGEEQAAVHRAAQRDPGRCPFDQLLDQVDGDLEQGKARDQAPERLGGRPAPGAQAGPEAAGEGGPERRQAEHDGGGDRRRPVGVAAAGQHGQPAAGLGNGQGVGKPVPGHRPGDGRAGQREPTGQTTQLHRQSIRGRAKVPRPAPVPPGQRARRAAGSKPKGSSRRWAASRAASAEQLGGRPVGHDAALVQDHRPAGTARGRRAGRG